MDRLQESRFELKYVISESCARAIRQFARPFVIPDENCDPAQLGYDIHSLYLDSPRLTCCLAAQDGHRNRFKLRIRFYDDSADGPVFFEVKRRINDVILKQRAAVRRSAADDLVDGHQPRMSHLFKANPKAFASLCQFCDLRDRLSARGKTLVSYRREAYMCPQGNDVRVTFDRRLHGRSESRKLLATAGTESPVDIGGVVFELKFTNRFPAWMAELVRTFNLRRRPMCKYLECTRELGMLPENGRTALHTGTSRLARQG